MNPATSTGLRLRITRHYVFGLAGAWLLVLAALPLGVPSLALAGVLLGMLVFLGAHAPRAPRLRVDSKLSQTTPAEEDVVDVDVTLENKGRRAIFGEWRFNLPGPSTLESGESAGFQFLPRGKTRTFSVAMKFHLFGLQRVGPLQLRVEDPFAYTVLEGSFGISQRVCVYPRREPLREPVMRSKQMRANHGAYEVSQPGTGFDFFGLRGYVHGDRPRDINWKASARSGNVIVNQHQRETDAEIVLFVDARAAAGVGRRTVTPFAQGCRAALAVAEAHLMSRDAVRFVAYGNGVCEDRHTGATRKTQGILDLIVGLEPHGETGLLDAVRQVLPSLRPLSPIMIFSPLVGDPSVVPAVSELVARGFPVRILVSRPELGDGVPELGRLEWEARQQVELARVRRAGTPAAVHTPGVLLEQSLMTLDAVVS